jgi:hypothetical protein
MNLMSALTLLENIQKLKHALVLSDLFYNLFMPKILLSWSLELVVDVLQLVIQLDFRLHYPTQTHQDVLDLHLTIYLLYFYTTAVPHHLQLTCAFIHATA